MIEITDLDLGLFPEPGSYSQIRLSKSMLRVKQNREAVTSLVCSCVMQVDFLIEWDSEQYSVYMLAVAS